ncbi:VOC family protein [Pyxidicoccus trucidator]|uniref:VOC family protein n=1 Tax=Pyxidicoccus trucidator TaxID=2709662 RepID=UPI0013DCFCD5|nr:VOC family protein [Pyxidicoccus trucidator]
MKTTAYYPVLLAPDVAEAARFYVTHFQFKPLFESDWYVHLQSTRSSSVNLGIVRNDHETLPQASRGSTSCLLLNFEVDDPDEVYARVQAANLPILRTLRDEPFGQRHFITADPNGVMIDVIKPIPPSAEFAAQYADEALPR